MIYLQTSVGLELRGEDMLFSSLQGNFSGRVFTHFRRIEGFRLRPPEDLRREIQHFFRSHGLSKDNIVVGIPRKDLILRYLDLPAEVADNLKQVVQYQVQSFEPTDEERFYHDFAMLRNGGAGKRISVMLAMVRKSMLDELLQFLLILGIRPVAVTTGAFGLSNLFLQENKDRLDRIFILGDLRASMMEILALQRGSVVYSREVPKEEDANWKDLILRETDEAASKIRLGPEGTLEKIVLAGEFSEAACEEVREVLSDCDLIGNRVALDIPRANKPFVQEAAASLGLAYTGMVRHPPIRINLLPPDRRIHQSRWAYIPAAILGLVIIALLCALAFHGTVQNEALARQLDQKIAEYEKPVERVRGYQKESEALRQKIKAFEDLLNNRDMNLEVLRELTNKLPADTYLKSYTWRDGVITISGLSGSASDLIPELEKSLLLKNVVSRGVFYKDNATGKEVFNFEARLEK